MPTPKSEYSIRERNRIACAKYKDAHPDRVRASTYKWRDANYSKFQSYNKSAILKRKYGITLKQWEEKFIAQGSCCLICKTSDPNSKRGWSTDHCHATNIVRGILCQACNIMLGGCRDNSDILRSAIAYLARFCPTPR